MSARTAGVLSGVLAALALPPFHLWPLAFTALVPVALAMSRRDAQRADAVAAGLAFGALFYGIVLHWIPFTVAGLVPFGAPLGFLTLVVLAGVGGLQAVLLHELLQKGAPPALALPAVWVSAEFLLVNAGPLAFPWTPLGLSFAAAPAWAAGAEWAGVHGLTLWICVVNGAVVAALSAPARVERRRWVWGAVVLTVVPAVAGIVRDRTLPTSDLPPILLGQMHVARDTLLHPDLRDPSAFEALERIIGAASPDVGGPGSPGAGFPGEAAMLILPEAPFAATWEEGVGDRVREHARGMGLSILIGARTRNGDEGLRNAVFRVDPEGVARRVHAKTRLVPGVERPGFLPGPAGGVVSVGAGEAVRLGLVICFESAFGTEARRLRRSGAELLVNVTNDGWFAPAFGPVPSVAHAQHRAHLILRAIETRMGAVRSSLGGEALVVGPTGRLLLSRPSGAEGIVSVRPTTSAATTGYVRYGDIGGLAGVLLLAGLVFRTRLLHARRTFSVRAP